jgi:aquaporin Z
VLVLGVEAGSYVVAQVIGATVASLTVPMLFGHASAAAITASPVQIMLAEFLGTFALVYTVLNVATVPATSGNSFYGLAIGFTVFVQAVAIGKTTASSSTTLSSSTGSSGSSSGSTASIYSGSSSGGHSGK